MIDHLFVYGTLRRSTAGSTHPLLAGASTFAGEARCAGRLYDLGPYPAAVPSRATEDSVCGELYLLHEPDRMLERLDAYEGEAYRREIVDAMRSDGDRCRTWIYYYDAPLHNAVHIRGGDYRTVRR